MILRRIGQHLGRQDWFAVSVELVVVVVGIVLGLQFADWWETRSDRELESYYLEQLLGDFDRSLAEWEGVLEQMREKRDRSVNAAQRLFEGNLDSESREAFQEDFNHLWGWLHLNFQTTTIDELRDTGRLTLISSNELRQEIIRYSTTVEVADIYNKNLGNMIIGLYVELSSGIRFEPGSLIIDSGDQELMADPSIYNTLNQIAFAHETIYQWDLGFFDETTRVRNLVRRAVEEITND